MNSRPELTKDNPRPDSSERAKPLWRVRSHLFWLVIACLLPGIIGALFLFIQQYRADRAERQKDTIQTARALAQAVDSYLVRVQAITQTLATDGVLAQGRLAEFHQRARETVRQFGPNLAIALYDADACQLLHTNQEFGQPLPCSPNANQIQRVFKTGEPAISDLFISPVLHQSLFTLEVPVRVRNKVAYVLSVGVLPAYFYPILRDQHLPPDRIVTILDKQGNIVARSLDPARFAGQKPAADFLHHFQNYTEGSLEATMRDGIRVQTFFTRSAIANWPVAVSIPTKALESQMVERLTFIALGISALFLVGLYVAWVMGNRIAHSFRALVGPATALGVGAPASPAVVHVEEAAEVNQALQEAAHVLRDRTEALRLAEARFRTLYNANLVGMIVTNGNGEVIEANDYFLEIIGYTRTELKDGQVDWRKVTPPEWLPADELSLAEMAAHGVFHPYEKEYLRRDGSRRSVILFNALLPGDTNEILSLVLDITEQREGQREIRRLNADLERRVEERTMELTRANEALLDSNEELQRFAYIASHDLQTPLRTISSFSQILQKDYRSRQLDERADEYLDLVIEGARRMHSLIRDLLAYSRIDSRTRPFIMVNLEDVFRSVVAAMDSVIGETGAEVTHGELPEVVGDPGQLTQLLQNLVENGIKYHGHERPCVHVWAERLENAWCVSVRDNGIGIDAKHQKAIFEIFRRLHTQRTHPGTGIGLSISRRVVERHGGHIWAESEPGKGSTFRFTLPFVSATKGNERRATADMPSEREGFKR